MLLTCVKMEHRISSHSHQWLVFLVIPLIPHRMGTDNYIRNLRLLKS